MSLHMLTTLLRRLCLLDSRPLLKALALLLTRDLMSCFSFRLGSVESNCLKLLTSRPQVFSQVLQRSLKVALYTQPLSPSSKYSFRSVLWGKLPTPLSLVLQPTFIEFCNTSVLMRFAVSTHSPMLRCCLIRGFKQLTLATRFKVYGL